MNDTDPSVVDDRPSDSALRAQVAALLAENDRLEKAVASRDAFLTIAAHELRNPMTPILGRVTLLRRAIERGDLPVPQITTDLERIERLVVQFIERATLLLDVSCTDVDRIEVRTARVDVAQLLDHVAESYRPLATHAGVALSVDLPNARNVVVAADVIALERVLENLVSNAIKYGAGAPIRITARASRAEGIARITVEDDGPGIAPEHQARIFERYERAVQEGSGIEGYGVGLWIVRKLCEAMGGSIELVSAQGKGCTFNVSLPLISPEETP